MKESNAVALVVVLLLALIIRAALEAIFEAISQQGWASISLLDWAQITVFFILILRFYLGAIRFGGTEPKNLNFHIQAVNFVFAFLLFCAFYAAAHFVIKPGSFYAIIVGLHSIDALWFLIAWVCSWSIKDENLEVGEIKMWAIRRVIVIFFSLSIFTIAYAFISYYWIFGQSILSDSPTISHWSFLSVLFALSFLDFVVLHKYYFNHAEWVKENRKS